MSSTALTTTTLPASTATVPGELWASARLLMALASAMARVQERRVRPSKPGKLHRV